MKSRTQQASSGKLTASVVSIVGLCLVWGMVWANLPSKNELLSSQPHSAVGSKSPVVPELDLAIPGIPSGRKTHALPVDNDRLPSIPPQDISNAHRARQIAEVKCEAEVQRRCPGSLPGDARQCMEQRMPEFSQPCQQIVRRRMVKSKEAEQYRFACEGDIQRICAGIDARDGGILQCLQGRAQDVSEPCYQSLPKGQLLLRH
jgi:hypothetical protein